MRLIRNEHEGKSGIHCKNRHKSSNSPTAHADQIDLESSSLVADHDVIEGIRMSFLPGCYQIAYIDMYECR